MPRLPTDRGGERFPGSLYYHKPIEFPFFCDIYFFPFSVSCICLAYREWDYVPPIPLARATLIRKRLSCGEKLVPISRLHCRVPTSSPGLSLRLKWRSEKPLAKAAKVAPRVFQQPWPGVSPTAVLNEEKALGTRLAGFFWRASAGLLLVCALLDSIIHT